MLSPDIVPLYWGKNASDWVVGSGNPDDDPNLINAYLDGFADFVSGVGQPQGLEPVTKQYGVWGGERYGALFICNGSCSSGDSVVADAGVVQRIQGLQSIGALPPSTPNRIFIVFLKGFTYDFGNICGYHSLVGSGGPYYAVIPYELAARGPDGATSTCSFQTAISHELFETMTDPYPNNGWRYSGGEGGDECVPWIGGVAHFPWGYTQTFADNVTGTCSVWSWPTTSTIVASNWPQNNERVNVFFTSPHWPGSLIHGYTSDGVNWISEAVAPSVSPINLVQAPTVVKPATNRIDAFVRGSAGPGLVGIASYLYHYYKTAGGAWTLQRISDGTLAQPSAVSTATNRIDLAARAWDASVWHYWSNDGTTFFSEDLPSQTIGPPTITSPGYFDFDVYTLGMHADQVVASQINGHPFSSFGTLVSGVNGLIPVPIAATAMSTLNKIAFGDMTGGDVPADSERWTYLPRFTVTNTNSGSWVNAYYALGATAPFGEYAVTSNVNGVDVAWMDRITFAYYHWHFSTVTHTWPQIIDTANWDPVQYLGGQYLNPPAISYGTDKAVYVFGVGFDDQLYSTKVTGSSISGPNPTGLYNVL